MALPATLNPARPSGTDAVNDPASTIDNQIRDLKQLIADLFGIPVDPTSLTAAAFSTTAGGLVSVAQPVTYRISGTLDRVTADATATGAEDTLYTFSLLGGSLGTNRAIRLTMLADGDTTGVETFTFRLKYGGTTIATVTATTATDSSWDGIQATGIVAGDGATNAQYGSLLVVSKSVADGIQTALDNGTAAVDSTIAQTLLLTGQSSGAGTIVLRYAILECLA